MSECDRRRSRSERGRGWRRTGSARATGPRLIVRGRRNAQMRQGRVSNCDRASSSSRGRFCESSGWREFGGTDFSPLFSNQAVQASPLVSN